MPETLQSSVDPEPLSGWSHKAAEIPERGLDIAREATPEELAALAEALDLAAIAHLKVTYRIRPLGGGRHGVKGALEAAVTQACGVTLEPVPATIAETFEEEYWPDELCQLTRPGGKSQEREVLSDTAPELIRQGLIEVGHLVYEQLSTAIDPYPRAPQAAFTWDEAGASGAANEPEIDNPFAALAALKEKT